MLTFALRRRLHYMSSQGSFQPEGLSDFNYQWWASGDSLKEKQLTYLPNIRQQGIQPVLTGSQSYKCLRVSLSHSRHGTARMPHQLSRSFSCQKLVLRSRKKPREMVSQLKPWTQSVASEGAGCGISAKDFQVTQRSSTEKVQQLRSVERTKTRQAPPLASWGTLLANKL